MNLYLLSQDVVCGYDTYDSCVVAAESEDEARKIHPSEFVTHVTSGRWMGTYAKHAKNNKAGLEYDNDYSDSWPSFCDIAKINVEYLGETDRERGVVLASFNAG
jgi:hypothetical protein